ncbi:MAG: putative SOS response-associated peptidase YedK [Arenicella sp.]|jgi:putative SOS response-associated peptidase YedK
MSTLSHGYNSETKVAIVKMGPYPPSKKHIVYATIPIMCGAYHTHLSAMHGWSESLKQWPEQQYGADAFPRSQVAAFRSKTGEAMRWQMIPPWAKEFDSKHPTHNARIETVEEKPTYRNAWRRKQHCLIPMAGYYEWTGEKGSKTKWYITDKDTDGLVVAELWDEWGKDKQLSCTMITRDADDYMSRVHHRMLHFLTPETAPAWMAGEMTINQLHDLELPNVIYYPFEA